jgi:hypothetical protein
MSAALTPQAAQRRSYLGIGSCCLFAIASGCVMALFLANWHAQYKLAGFEGIIVLPVALLLYVVGTLMGFAGTRRPTQNPLSATGLILNLLPIAAVIALVLLGLLWSIFRSCCPTLLGLIVA